MINMNRYTEVFKQLVQTNYLTYCYWSNRNIDKGWKPSKLHRFLCDTVQKFVETDTGHAYDILLLSVPPQFGKSVTITETFPAFYLSRNPKHRVIEISYNSEFAQKFGRRNKAKIEDLGPLFGVSLSKDSKSSTEWELDNGTGGMMSRGVLSGVTGNPCNLMIIDDPIKNRTDADSESHRQQIKNEWQNSFKTRFASGAKCIVIQTRWHEDDLYGYIGRTEENVTVINIPCEAEEDDILGRAPGEGLCPEIGKGTDWLNDFKKSFLNGDADADGESGIRAWNALFQGRPVSVEGNLLQRDWWQSYDYHDGMKFDSVILSCDAAFKDSDTSDFVAISVWGKRDGLIYLIDMVNRHLNLMGTVREIKRLCAVYSDIRQKYIEDKANGPAIMELLRGEMTGVIPVTPEGGKVARVNAVSYLVEAGNVFLPRNRSFTNEFIEQCAAFPNGKHDDMVDSFSQGVAKLMKVSSGRKAAKKKKPLFRFMDKSERRLDIGDDIYVV